MAYQPSQGGRMVSGKRVIVAGGCGLLGREIVNQFRISHSDVKSLDTHPNADIVDDLKYTSYTWLFDNLDVFVNASYPKSVAEHFETFLKVSSIVASTMSRRGGGSMVNLASIYGIVGGKPDMYVGTDVKYPPVGYSAAKGAIISLSRALACKYGPNGVRVNVVSPGGVFDGQDVEFVKRYKKRVPLGRMATPKDVAEAVVFLSGASYITGINLIIDGGLTSQ